MEKMIKFSVPLIIVYIGGLCDCGNLTDSGHNSRQKRQGLGVFTVVKFPNAICDATSSNFNGTCYTESECSTLGGSASGSCASGFGVCCIFSMSCGTTVSQNLTYHAVSSYSTANDANPCRYTICPCSNNICKLRIDFDTFNIAGPPTVTSNNQPAGAGPAVGDCDVDSFTVTSPQGTAPPVICGLNTGQHIFVDANDACNIISFNIDSGTTTTRSWSLKVTQYECDSPVAGVVDDCLQYYTGTSGTIQSFNYDTTASNGALTSANTHLSSQDYAICFRQERGFCQICFSTASNPGTSFSVSASAAAPAAQSASTSCTGVPGAFGDFVEVMNLNAPPTTTTTNGVTRVCGNFFNAIEGQTSSVTLCSAHIPFRWHVRFDEGEVIADTSPGNNFNAAENFAQGGMIGFNMDWFQTTTC